MKHIDVLHRTTERTMGELLERAVGLDWEQRYEALEATRAQEKRIIETPPHGQLTDEQGRSWDTWLGSRATDEEQSAVGYYRAYPIDRKEQKMVVARDELDIEFRPLTRGLSRQQAEHLSAWLRAYRQMYPEATLAEGFAIAQGVDAMDSEARRAFFEEIRGVLQPVIAPSMPEQARSATDEAWLYGERREPDCWGELPGEILMRGYLVTQSTDTTHTVGIYWQADDLALDVEEQFESLLGGLTSAGAADREGELRAALHREPERGADVLREMAAGMLPSQPDKPSFGPALDLDL